MQRHVFRMRSAALAAVLLATLAARPALTVNVEGVQLTALDVANMTVLALDGSGLMRNATMKVPGDMPVSQPYFYYAGRDAKGMPIVWIAKSIDGRNDAIRPELQREEVGVAIVAVLDSGIDPNIFAKQREPIIDKLHPLIAATGGDPERINRLGLELADAIRQMSDLTVAQSTADRKWMFATLTTSMTRAQVYDALRSRGLQASSASGRAFPADGPATVTLAGSFEPGCSFSNAVAITFDATNHVEKLDYGIPTPDCL